MADAVESFLLGRNKSGAKFNDTLDNLMGVKANRRRRSSGGGSSRRERRREWDDY